MEKGIVLNQEESRRRRQNVGGVEQSVGLGGEKGKVGVRGMKSDGGDPIEGRITVKM
jgi:hypothetical protein